MRRLYNSFVSTIEKRFHVDAHYFLKGGFWLSLTQVVSILGGLVTSVLFAKYLDPNDYGIYRYLIGLVAIFSAFSLTGLGQSILQTAAKKYYSFYSETLRTNFIYSLSITAISIAGSSYYFFNNNSLLATGCLLIAVSQPLIITFSNSVSYLQGRGRYKDSTIVQAAKTIVITMMSVIAIFLTDNILILFTVFLGSQLITNYVAHILYKPGQHSPTPKEIFTLYKSYALHTSGRNFIGSIANRADTILVFTQLGAVELAIYSIATIVPDQLRGSFKNLTVLLLPKYAAHTDIKTLKQGVTKRSLQLFIILIIITAVYILIAPYIYQIIFPKYDEAIFYSQLYALAFPTFILFIPYSILQSQLEERKLYKLTMYSSIFQTVSVFFGILFFGLMGAIIARISYLVFLTIASYYYMQKIK